MVGVRIYPPVRHLDVGSTRPSSAKATKGQTVLLIMGYVSWVQAAVRQAGLYLVWCQLSKDVAASTQRVSGTIGPHITVLSY